MAKSPFLDTNVFLRHLRQDHPGLSPKATAIIARIEQRTLTVRTSDAVVFETVFTLERTYKQPRERIAAALLPLLEMPGIVLPGKERYRAVFDLYCQGPLGFADSYHVMLMHRLGINEIFSFDRGFDLVAGVRRREE